MNFLHAIGVLLIIIGFSSFVIGILRYFFPSLESYVADEFKKPFTIGSGIFITLAGMLILKI
ncbi:MAG: hypothetical protein V3U78_06030 [Thiotrichaceae bacterium]